MIVDRKKDLFKGDTDGRFPEQGRVLRGMHQGDDGQNRGGDTERSHHCHRGGDTATACKEYGTEVRVGLCSTGFGASLVLWAGTGLCAVLVPQQARCRFASTSPRAGFPSTPFVSNEIPFDPIDSNAYMMFRVAMGRNQQIVSDDLLMKLNQIGTATVGSSVASTSHLVDRGPVGWGVRCGGEAGKLPGWQDKRGRPHLRRVRCGQDREHGVCAALRDTGLVSKRAFKREEEEEILRIAAGILHLANLGFAEDGDEAKV